MKDKVILITGAAHRVGAEIARVLHQNGANVILHFRHSKPAATTLADELNQQRTNSAAIIQADLDDSSTYTPLINNSKTIFGRLDGLINNASTFYRTSCETVNFADWDNIMASNLKAPFFLSQAAIPFLRENSGSIINIVDIHAERPMKGYPVYSIAKAGLAMLTKSLAKELGPEIRVNGIAPGAVAWPEHLTEQIKQQILDRTSLKKPGSPKDVALAALFLMRDAPYVTGQIITIDGGRSLNL